jgi:uncharacterized membrane protein
MAIVCGYCGASMPDISEYCPACGRPVREGTFLTPEPPDGWAPERDEAPPAVALPPVPWSDRLVGALAYLTFVPAVLFIFLKQFQGRKFVRFHSFQSVFFWSVVIVLLLLGVLASTFGWLFVWLLVGALVLLAMFFIWAILWIKALQGEWFELPVLGALAGQQAGRS